MKHFILTSAMIQTIIRYFEIVPKNKTRFTINTLRVKVLSLPIAGQEDGCLEFTAIDGLVICRCNHSVEDIAGFEVKEELLIPKDMMKAIKSLKKENSLYVQVDEQKETITLAGSHIFPMVQGVYPDSDQIINEALSSCFTEPFFDEKVEYDTDPGRIGKDYKDPHTGFYSGFQVPVESLLKISKAFKETYTGNIEFHFPKGDFLQDTICGFVKDSSYVQHEIFLMSTYPEISIEKYKKEEKIENPE